jgi:hypothetical protein
MKQMTRSPEPKAWSTELKKLSCDLIAKSREARAWSTEQRMLSQELRYRGQELRLNRMQLTPLPPVHTALKTYHPASQ